MRASMVSIRFKRSDSGHWSLVIGQWSVVSDQWSVVSGSVGRWDGASGAGFAGVWGFWGGGPAIGDGRSTIDGDGRGRSASLLRRGAWNGLVQCAAGISRASRLSAGSSRTEIAGFGSRTISLSPAASRPPQNDQMRLRQGGPGRPGQLVSPLSPLASDAPRACFREGTAHQFHRRLPNDQLAYTFPLYPL